MNNDQVTNLLTTILLIMIGVLFFLSVIYIVLKVRESKRKHRSEESITNNSSKENSNAEKGTIQYSKQSIFSFMKFDKIEDDMIIRKNGTKFLMVIECQGINYDLMSGMEKNSVEQGFLQFLNTLKHPIQIYTQTRTVNLGSSIEKYKERLKLIENRLVSKQLEYNSKANSKQYTEEQLMKERVDVVRERNLYEYGKDIINNTERMNLNKNILRRHYYIVISYIPEEVSNPDIQKSEIRDMAFNELYTKCQSAIASLAVCGLKGKILNSNELAELLYMAYNRDDADVYQLNQALDAKYDELYVTAQDVLEKRMKVLDQKIEEEAIRKANEKLTEAAEESEREKEVKKKEKDMQALISKMAKMLIDENQELVGTEIAQKAKEKIDEEDKGEGGKENEEKQTTTRRKKKIS
ncbi:MAG: hypothetical protein HFJ35_03935 [Clostridia bacterium]|nr:hypothetical protein [Clostridia bacterium]